MLCYVIDIYGKTYCMSELPNFKGEGILCQGSRFYSHAGKLNFLNTTLFLLVRELVQAVFHASGFL